MLLRHLAQVVEVEWLATTEGGYGERLVEGIPVHACYPRGGPYDGLTECLNRYGPFDLAHVEHEYGIFGDEASLDLCRVLEEAKAGGLVRRVVYTLHTVYHPLSGRPYALEFQGKLGACADAVIVHSRLQEFELMMQGFPAQKLHRIPHGTLLNPYLGYTRRELLGSLGVEDPGTQWLIVTPGFMRPDKGLDVLVEVARRVREWGYDAEFIAAGEPRGSMPSGLSVLPRFLSSDEILRLVAAADVVVLPYRMSRGYSVSGILHLSMGALKPIVGTRVPRLVELYTYAPRLTVPPGDATQLAAKLAEVLDRYDEMVAYSATLYGYAVRTQWARMARRHYSLYQQLLSTT